MSNNEGDDGRTLRYFARKSEIFEAFCLSLFLQELLFSSLPIHFEYQWRQHQSHSTVCAAAICICSKSGIFFLCLPLSIIAGRRTDEFVTWKYSTAFRPRFEMCQNNNKKKKERRKLALLFCVAVAISLFRPSVREVSTENEALTRRGEMHNCSLSHVTSKLFWRSHVVQNCAKRLVFRLAEIVLSNFFLVHFYETCT